MSVATAVHELLELRKALESQPQDAETVLEILEQASKAQVTPQLLHQTSLGRTVASLKKSQHVRVSQRAKEIVLAWKSVVLTETAPSRTHSSATACSASSANLSKFSVSVPSATSAASLRSNSCPNKSNNTITLMKQTISRSSTGNLPATTSRAPSTSKLTTTLSSSSKLGTTSSPTPITSSLPSVSFAAPDPKPLLSAATNAKSSINVASFSEATEDSTAARLSEAILSIDETEMHRHDSSTVYKLNSTNSKVRNKIQELVYTAMGEANDLVKAELAVRLEAALFAKHGSCSPEYREHSREILGNLRDPNNPVLRFHLLSGAWTTEELVHKSVYDLAGDDLKKQRQEDAAWMDGWRRADWQQANRPKGGCDLFKCAKCGARDTTWTQKQTRSADEPMTTFVLCNNCGKRWRMC